MSRPEALNLQVRVVYCKTSRCVDWNINIISIAINFSIVPPTKSNGCQQKKLKIFHQNKEIRPEHVEFSLKYIVLYLLSNDLFIRLPVTTIHIISYGKLQTHYIEDLLR